jgi:hypothetical protein
LRAGCKRAREGPRKAEIDRIEPGPATNGTHIGKER